MIIEGECINAESIVNLGYIALQKYICIVEGEYICVILIGFRV